MMGSAPLDVPIEGLSDACQQLDLHDPAAALLDLPLKMLTGVCQQLDLRNLVCVAATCKRFRHGDCRLETVELPKSPSVAALRELAFPGRMPVLNTRPIGCSDLWVAYLARCARQRRCREALPIAAGYTWSLFVNAAGRLLACGKGATSGHGGAKVDRAQRPAATRHAPATTHALSTEHAPPTKLGRTGPLWTERQYQACDETRPAHEHALPRKHAIWTKPAASAWAVLPGPSLENEGRARSYSVPFSEHSSWRELQARPAVYPSPPLPPPSPHHHLPIYTELPTPHNEFEALLVGELQLSAAACFLPHPAPSSPHRCYNKVLTQRILNTRCG
jgi:hypothetical protein